MHSSVGALVLHPALRMLWDSYRVAENAAIAGGDSAWWPFSQPASQLFGESGAVNLLPWLLSKGYARALAPPDGAPGGSPRSGDSPRSGRRGARGHVEPNYVLTPPGERWLAHVAAVAGAGESGLELTTGAASVFPADEKPAWNAVSGVLRWNGGQVSFSASARNLRPILSAFEEEGWPPRVDDPLLYERDVEPKQRLRDAISNLNQAFRKRRVALRLRGDGSGEGILWCVGGTEVDLST